MLTFYYSQFSPPLFPVDVVAALPDSFIYLFLYFFLYFHSAQSGGTRMCPFHWSAPSEMYRCCSRRLQRATQTHCSGTPTVNKRAPALCQRDVQGRASEGKVRPINIHPLRKLRGWCGLTQLYEQITEMQRKKNSQRCINLKARRTRLGLRPAHAHQFLKKKKKLPHNDILQRLSRAHYFVVLSISKRPISVPTVK